MIHTQKTLYLTDSNDVRDQHLLSQCGFV